MILGDNRLGRFKVSLGLLEDGSIDASDCLQAIMKKVIILRAGFDACCRCMEYAAYSSDFDPIDSGETPPMYNVICVTKEGKFDSFLFQKERRI